MPQSAWQDYLDVRNGDWPNQRPRSEYTIDCWRLPDCDFRSPEYGNELTDWYWKVSLGTLPINGGLTTGPSTGKNRAEQAIYVFEWTEFREGHYWDVETCRWWRRGELPPLE